MNCSKPTPGERLVARLSDHEVARWHGDWQTWARPDQLAPEPGQPGGDWKTWLLLGGRGSGKTRSGAEWIRRQALAAPGRRIALIGQSQADARAVMVEGISGLLAIHKDHERPLFESSRRLLTWPNGSAGQLFSAEDPDGLRGPQFHAAWCDELAKWPRADAAWDMLQFALRLGHHPQQVVTTTPRPVALIKQLLDDDKTHVSRSATADNAANLPAAFLDHVQQHYGGTRLGRQELDGELISDNPDGLFNRDLIEAGRVRTCPDVVRIVVAVDPPVTSKRKSNACGIICAGLGTDGKAYVLDDASLEQASPVQWASRAIALYHARCADRLIAEVNQGGEMVETIVRSIDPAVAFCAVHASRGKQLRAEPVAALYEQQRVCHAGTFPELEDEMCAFEQAAASSTVSPDRVDALVWAITGLMLSPRRASPRVRAL